MMRLKVSSIKPLLNSEHWIRMDPPFVVLTTPPVFASSVLGPALAWPRPLSSVEGFQLGTSSTKNRFGVGRLGGLNWVYNRSPRSPTHLTEFTTSSAKALFHPPLLSRRRLKTMLGSKNPSKPGNCSIKWNIWAY